MEQAAYRGRADLPARARQRRGELRPTLAGPSQRRLRVATGHRVNQGLQCLLDSRLRLLNRRPSRARAPDAPALGCARFQLPASLADGRARQSRRVRDQRIASISDGPRFRGRPDTPPTLIEKSLYRRILLNDGRFEFKIASHRNSRTQYPIRWKLNLGYCPKSSDSACFTRAGAVPVSVGTFTLRAGGGVGFRIRGANGKSPWIGAFPGMNHRRMQARIPASVDTALAPRTPAPSHAQGHP